MTATESRAQVRLPVMEVFGPTVQGEGPQAGLPVHFIRLGGCDFRCSWCDTMYAVDPAQVRANAVRTTPEDVVQQVRDLGGGARWVVLSGGNPALHRCRHLVDGLHRANYDVALETQGSVWRDWIGECDQVVVSPKPPSSGMDTHDHRGQRSEFMRKARRVLGSRVALKIVVGDQADLAWAKRVFRAYPTTPAYLSVLTPVGEGATTDQLRVAVCDRWRWLAEAVANEPDLARCRVLPQLHVLAWGEARGV